MVLAITCRECTFLAGTVPNLYSRCLWPKTSTSLKECVARMTCLYKNNGAVSCVGGNALFIWSLYLPICLLIEMPDTLIPNHKLHGILPWPRADINKQKPQHILCLWTFLNIYDVDLKYYQNGHLSIENWTSPFAGPYWYVTRGRLRANLENPQKWCEFRNGQIFQELQTSPSRKVKSYYLTPF